MEDASLARRSRAATRVLAMGRRKRSSWVPRAKQRETILNLRAEGVSPDAIARALHLDVTYVEQVFAGSSQDDAASGQAANNEAVVKRLMKDPKELCCPLSYALMEDPVVAADGFTYERSWVEEHFRRAPGKSPMTGSPMSTTVLNPIQQTRSLIVSFKEETVKEILFVVPRLANHQALELLKRGEDFVRPLLPDASASKKLASLLLLRMKLAGTDHGDIAEEVVSLLLALQDEAFLREAFLDMKESDLLALLPSLDEESLCKLHRVMSSWNAPGIGLVDREQARRLASHLQLEAKSRGSALLSVVWDLSRYDFTGFVKGQEQLSKKFQLPGSGQAWMELFPKGEAKSSWDKAGLYLQVDKPALVKWTVQSGSSEAKTVERDFSKGLKVDGTPNGCGWCDFMPISEANGRVTLRILSVRAPTSSLCLF